MSTHSDRALTDHYEKASEKDRLSGHWGQLEYVRTKSIIQTYLPEPPAKILDIGGASGIYSCWLAKLGYEVYLVDPVPKHIDQARDASGLQPESPLAGIELGDARKLSQDDGFADIILLLGPLYHLIHPPDRMSALSESCRVLKPGGLLFGGGISRFASCIDGFMSGYFKDRPFQKIMNQDLKDGQHRNTTDNPLYFMDTFFHHPDELRTEIESAGFKAISLHAVEGIGYMMADFEENWRVESYRKLLLDIVSKTDTEASLIGASPHLLCVASK